MITYKIGSRGEVVKQIQKALHLLPDGIFGTLTRDAVTQFQVKNRLKADGIVGSATLSKLIPARFKRSKRRITEIIVHCSATPEGKDYTVFDIRRWHKQQGWSDIGYHYVVYRNGHIEAGRDVDIIGAHCEGHNAHSIGVCYIGGVARDGKTPKDTRTLAQKASLISVLTELRQMYPQAKIYGHRDFAHKDCPSFDAKLEYKNI
jgi:N-acetylmuramoyl-L-alanine amidase